MTRMGISKGWSTVLALAAIVGSSVSCGDLVRQGRSPVYLVIDSLTAGGSSSGFLLSDVRTNGSIFDDTGEVILSTSLKNIGTPTTPTAPTSNNDVTITRIHVAYRRADGRNTPGVDVPYAFDAAATGTISGTGSLTLTFELVRHEAKVESPLIQLANGLGVITTLTDVTFYGRDQVGNEVNVTGTIQINFGDFADEA